MSHSYLSIVAIERRLSTGEVETLTFEPGVNALVGAPNTGKTKWLQTLDFLLGDVGENPFEGAEESGLAEKYDAATVRLIVAGEELVVQRRWREAGVKTKVFVGDLSMTARDFQHLLMEKIGMPLLSFPKGNPMSGQTWPELSFRMLLRHIYRQQRFWGGLADQQPDGEQHACLLQFLGLAERIFTEKYGRLIEMKMAAEKLKVRREHYGQTLQDFARDVISEPGLTVSVTSATIKTAQQRLVEETAGLRKRRNEVLAKGGELALPAPQRGYITGLGEKRARILVKVEEDRLKGKNTAERIESLRRYRTDLADELDRIARAEDAGSILANLRITHCPACDQTVTPTNENSSHCFLCHQQLPDDPVVEELGVVRLRFEQDRLAGELKEADELLSVVQREQTRIQKEISEAEEMLRSLENELAPSRQAVAAFAQDEVSAVDVALGQADERERQLKRLAGALEIGTDLTARIAELEKKIEPLQREVEEAARATDFEAAASILEDGMNEYLSAINVLRPHIWRHSPIKIDLSKAKFEIRVGSRRWHAALGGTDTLYFLMAYHYGLLASSPLAGGHYPGLAIIDVPGEFSGEAIEDKENFIVQPFIELLSRKGYEGAQVIITGASFTGLLGVQFQHLRHVYAT
jgi:hypothetical protein